MKKQSNQILVLLKYLSKAEGTQIHFNKGEKDITSMYGVYKYSNPKAKIFKEIQKLAIKLDLHYDSRNWQEDDLIKINNFINKDEKLVSNFILLAAEFYETYLIKARLDMFHKDSVVAMFSMFVNSRRLAWKSVQYAINTMFKNGFIDYETLKEDSKVGNKTMLGLEKCLYVCNHKKHLGLLFESYMLLGMSAEYSYLIKKNPKKYNRFSTGWDNRLKELQQRR